MQANSPFIPTPRPSNPTALELTIHRFEQQAREYHYNKAFSTRKNESKVKRHARHEVFNKDMEHLRRERIRIAALASLQSDLRDYRADNLVKDADDLAEEKHHPTAKLANNLRAVNEPKPSLNHDPHHIIMGKGRWQAMQMMNARLTLHIHGIGINDPINGVWLPRNKKDKGHWATPKAPAHREIHRFNYETWISFHLGSVDLPEHVFRNRLKAIKHSLKFGGYPEKIIQKKDKNWTGEEL